MKFGSTGPGGLGLLSLGCAGVPMGLPVQGFWGCGLRVLQRRASGQSATHENMQRDQRKFLLNCCLLASRSRLLGDPKQGLINRTEFWEALYFFAG